MDKAIAIAYYEKSKYADKVICFDHQQSIWNILL